MADVKVGETTINHPYAREGAKDEYYVKGASGKVFRATPEQAEHFKEYDFVSPEYAQQATAAQLDKDWAEKKFGTVGAGLMGFGNEMALGLPALANIKIAEAIGDARYADSVRSIMSGLQQTGAYKVGGALGIILPTLATAGEATVARGVARGGIGLLSEAGGAAERLAVRLIPETPGLLGTAGRSALGMAARGATEAALLSVTQTMQDYAIRNKPLTVEALAASGVDGALFGGLAGGALGGAGAIIGGGAERIGSAIVGKGASRADSMVARRLGVSAEEFSEIESRPGGFAKWRETAGEELAKKKLDYASSTKKMAQAADEIAKDNAVIRRNITEELDRSFPASAPKVERITERYMREVVEPMARTPAGVEAERFLKKIIAPEFRVATEVEEKVLSKSEFGAAQKAEAAAERAKQSELRAKHAEEQARLKSAHEYSQSFIKSKFRTPFSPKKFVDDVGAAATKSTYDDVATIRVTHEPIQMSWKEAGTLRDQLSEMARGAGPNSKLAKEALGILDSEMVSGMAMAEMRGGPAMKGVAQQYQAATLGERVMQELSAIASRRVGSEVVSGFGATLTPHDVGAFGRTAVIGGAVAGVPGVAAAGGALAAKGIGRILDRRLTPVLAEMAHKNALSAKAGVSVANAQTRIRGSIKKFFTTGAKHTVRLGSYAKTQVKEPQAKMTREEYQRTLDHVRTLVSDHHAAAVQEWAELEAANLHPDFAQHVLDAYGRSRNYLQMNIPPSINTLNGSNLRKLPTPKGLNFGEYRFMRIQNVIRDPWSFLDKLESGKVTTDEARALKYVYPEIHAQITESVMQEVYDMKLQGRFLPIDKVAALGVALDHPIDSTLTSEYIGAVQAALNSPTPEPPQPPTGDQGITPTDFMTPVQKLLNG